MKPILILPALLALLADAHAQSEQAPPAPSTVVVNGTRAGRSDPTMINTAKDRILSGKRASSCAFMDTHSGAKTDVYQNYMRDFGLENDQSNEVEKFSMMAPGGDVSNAALSSSIDPNAGVDAMARDVDGCGAADRRFAAGQRHILLKDKSLALAFEAYDTGDFARAVAQFTTAWNKIGYDEAALMLARLNLYGQGTPKDARKAIYWLDQVANGRADPADQLRYDPAHPDEMTPKIEAAFMLARIHERGLGLPADPQEARRWYAKAADLGFAPAAYHLGQIYYDGTNVPQDFKQAAAWFGAAARAGHPGAQFALGRMLDQGEGMAADPAQAIGYYKDAALKGNRDAQFAIGTYFYGGEVVPKDVVAARKWFEAAARQGQPDAMFNLGAMLSNGEGGAKDPALAYVWFSLANQAGYQGAAAAARALGPRLTTADRGRADAILKPQAVR